MSVGHYENFPVASCLVPRRFRPTVVAIYRFARAADDLADEGVLPAADRLAALDAFERSLEAIARGETPGAPPFPALAHAIRAHALPIHPFHDLLSAFRQDVRTSRYDRLDDLLDYCRRSANPIGRLLLALYHAQSAGNHAASDALCTGLQLTNFLQDVGPDWERGRLYLPREDLDRFGVTEDEIGRGRAGARWAALMRFQTTQAREWLARGRTLVRALPLRLGLEVSGVIAGGERILDRIDAVDGDVFRRRPTLGASDWALVAGRALARRPFPGAGAT